MWPPVRIAISTHPSVIRAARNPESWMKTDRPVSTPFETEPFADNAEKLLEWLE